MKKMFALIVTAGVVLCASAMMRLSYVKVSDPGCNKCSITNEGATRVCGKCTKGFLRGGKDKLVDGGWLQADFTCNKCGHSSTWKYKNK